MKTRWFTSDLHFGHYRVIEYCNRPYKTVEEMHDDIIKRWNSQVHPADTVYVLGDFSLQPKWSAEMLPKLNGNKVLIMGNHDATFPKVYGRINKKADKMRERYLNDGWNDVLMSHQLELYNGQTVLMSHLPYANEQTLKDDKRYLEYRPEDKGMVLLHGHMHCRYRKSGRMIDVGFDGDLKLFSERDIVTLINDERDFIPSPITDFYRMSQPRVLE